MIHRLVSRRSFLSSGTVTAGAVGLTAASYAKVLGANERVGIGCIGFGLIGERHLLDFQEQPDAEIRGVAEAHAGRLEEAVDATGGTAMGHRDFRRLLDDANIDAVVVSTPDHWHALQTMLACAADKDVYVEKPLTLFPREGRWMIDVARRHGRVVQVGTQQRSGAHYQRAKQLIQEGQIGQVVAVRADTFRNILPGYGSPPDGDPPPELDYEMWLGPAPSRAYNPLRSLYHFRWFWDYSGGQTTNLGQHSFDMVDWIIGVDGLKRITSTGGRFHLRDGGETPDIQDALFDFGDWQATWSYRECSAGPRPVHNLVFCGTKGTLGIGRRGFTLTPDAEIPPENTVPRFADDPPVGGPQRSSAPRRWRTEAVNDRSGDDRRQFKDHVRNFLDCVKSRAQPNSDLESGHRVATLCHLANISLRLGRPITWSYENEEISGDEEASAMLVRPYRAPWDRELVALGVA